MAGRLSITIMREGLEAQARVVPGDPAERKELDEALAAEGVSFGIDQGVCEQLAEALSDPDFASDEAVVARGTPPDPGADGVLTLCFNEEPLPGQVRDDGSFDFRDRGLLTRVACGDLIATYSPPKEPRPGTDVHGNEVIPEPPAEALPELREGVELTDAGEIRATLSGVISFGAGSGVMEVMSCIEHSADVDLRSGNLEMEGKLVICGDVTRNAEVTATDDVIITGMVDGGTVRSRASISIEKGVIGSEAGPIYAAVDLTCHDAVGADLRARGGLHVQTNVINSRLSATKISVGNPKGRVVGGELRAAETAQVHDAGTKHWTHTVVWAGVPFDPEGDGENSGGLKIRLDDLMRARVYVAGVAHPGVTIRIGNYTLELEQSVRAVSFRYDAEEASGIRMDHLAAGGK